MTDMTEPQHNGPKATIDRNWAIGFEGVLRQARLFIDADPHLRAEDFSIEASSVQELLLVQIGSRLRMLRAILGPRLEQSVMTAETSS